MATNRLVPWAAALILGGWVAVMPAWAQDNGPDAQTMAERLRARGSEVTPEQVEQGRKIMEDMRNGVQPDPQAVQQLIGAVRNQMQGRLKEMLGASDDEWQILNPKITKVQNLMLQSGNGGGMMGGNAGGMLARFGVTDPGAAAGAGPSEVRKAQQALQEVLRNKDATSEQIKAATQACRDARAKLKAQLEDARKELKALLVIRQEAILVQLGMLE